MKPEMILRSALACGLLLAATPLFAQGDAAKGQSLVESSGCLSCHRIGEKGSHVGPNLTDIGEKRNAARLLASLKDPDAEVLPENRFVNVVLKDGTSVRGRLLNHDGLSVQLIDTHDNLRSFTLQQMKSYEIQTKGLMPPQSKLSDKDVADIVSYLEGLKGSGN